MRAYTKNNSLAYLELNQLTKFIMDKEQSLIYTLTHSKNIKHKGLLDCLISFFGVIKSSLISHLLNGPKISTYEQFSKLLPLLPEKRSMSTQKVISHCGVH